MFASSLWTLTQAKALTGKEHIVLQALASFKGHKGLFPSHTSIAIKAGCSVATVIRTLKKAYDLGIVKKIARRNLHSSGRIVRGTNLYELVDVDLTELKKLAKVRAEKLKAVLALKKAQLINRFSMLQNDSEYNSQSESLYKRQHHLGVNDYKLLIERWAKEARPC